MELEQKMHEESSLDIILSLKSFSFVFNFPRITNQTNISVRKGTRPFHMPLDASKFLPKSMLASSKEKDFTEKLPDLFGA